MHKTAMRVAFEGAKVTPTTDPKLVQKCIRALERGAGLIRLHSRGR